MPLCTFVCEGFYCGPKSYDSNSCYFTPKLHQKGLKSQIFMLTI